MRIEHLAFVTREPAVVAKWYVAHLGFEIKRAMDVSPFMHFLADEQGMMIEIYRQPHIRVPDYRDMDPLLLHLAFVSNDVGKDRAGLITAGATAVGEIQETPTGNELAMLRDPWGFAIQLARRASPMV